MNNIYMLNITDFLDIYQEAIELGKQRGIKQGENLEKEFFQVAKELDMMDKLDFLGKTNKDLDLLTGDLRENNYKVINLNEIKRKNENIL